MINIGDEITFYQDIINISGDILFTKGQKVKIRKVHLKAEYFSKTFNIFVPENIYGIEIEGSPSMWSVNSFEETKDKTLY